MARNFKELEAQLSPEQRKRADARVREELGKMLLSEFRRLSGKSQAQLAEALGIKQPNVSKLEAQDDMHVSTLLRIVHALGAELEIVVKAPNGKRFVLNQFSKSDAA